MIRTHQLATDNIKSPDRNQRTRSGPSCGGGSSDEYEGPALSRYCCKMKRRRSLLLAKEVTERSCAQAMMCLRDIGMQDLGSA